MPVQHRRGGRAATGADVAGETLPAEVEELLVELIADGFTLYCCGPKVGQSALVACYEWDGCVDLLVSM